MLDRLLQLGLRGSAVGREVSGSGSVAPVNQGVFSWTAPQRGQRPGLPGAQPRTSPGNGGSVAVDSAFLALCRTGLP